MPLFPSYIYTYIYTYRQKPSLYQTYRSSLSEKRGTAPTFPHKSINPSNPPETITSPTPRGLNSVQARCQRNVLPPPSQLPLFLRKPNFHLKKEKKRGGGGKKKEKAKGSSFGRRERFRFAAVRYYYLLYERAPTREANKQRERVRE